MFLFCLSEDIFSFFLNLGKATITFFLSQLEGLLALYPTKGYYFDQLSLKFFKLSRVVSDSVECVCIDIFLLNLVLYRLALFVFASSFI